MAQQKSKITNEQNLVKSLQQRLDTLKYKKNTLKSQVKEERSGGNNNTIVKHLNAKLAKVVKLMTQQKSKITNGKRLIQTLQQQLSVLKRKKDRIYAETGR
ncbi:hypothetical protein SPONN_1384 [uncultured Candidatus Thioglobus sp.]|nr:hypothetical protein SPONN_1384 [uncultured Candidatus Thioglobus sp.]